MHAQRTPLTGLEQPAPPLIRRTGGAPIWNGLGRTPVGFWLLEPRIHWYGVHWIEGRARPCLSTVGRCQPCEDAWLPRPSGYISAMHARTGGRYILRITDNAYRNCPALAIENANYKGQPVVMARLGEAKNSPWKIDIQPVAKVPPLPPANDVIGVLSMIWGIDLRRVAQLPPPDGDLTRELRPYEPRKRGKR